MIVTCWECQLPIRLPGQYRFDGWRGRTILCSKPTQRPGFKKIRHQCEGFRPPSDTKGAQ